MDKFKEKAETLKDLAKDHICEFCCDLEDFKENYPIFSGLTEAAWIVYLTILISSRLKCNRGKTLAWIDITK